LPFAITPAQSDQSESKPLFPTEGLTAFALVTGLFFLWGIPNNLNDVLIRQFMKSFEITRLQAGLVQSAFYTGYFLFSIPAAMVMRRFGYKTGLITGLLLYSTGTFLFLPAADILRLAGADSVVFATNVRCDSFLTDAHLFFCAKLILRRAEADKVCLAFGALLGTAAPEPLSDSIPAIIWSSFPISNCA